MKNKQKAKAFGIMFAVIFALIILLLIIYLYQNRRKTADLQAAESQTVQSQTASDVVTYDGKQYKYNTGLTNILFLGVDKKEEVTLQNTPGTAGQSDCIMILSLNKEDHSARILQIPRDTMTEVDIYDISGNYFSSVTAQVATQYAYGDGESGSCWASKKTISELLYGLQIDGYISLNIDSISTLNDAVGGVTITVPEDYTAIDPAFTAGATLTLTGEQAEKYVRYRDTNEFGSNVGRMNRQTQYIPALISAVKAKVGSAGDLYETFYPVLQSYLVTDLSADQIDTLSEYNYNPDLTEYVPGEIKMGAEHEEFYADDVSLKELLLKVFYKEVS